MFRIRFDGYLRDEEFDTYDEAYEYALTLKSAYNQGSVDLWEENPGDFEEESYGSTGDFDIEEW